MTVMDRAGNRTVQQERRDDRGADRAQEPTQEQQEQKVNVGDGERAVSVAAGAIVSLLGLSRRSLPGLLIAGVGGAMMYRGATGHCPAYQSLGVDTAIGGEQGQSVEEEIARHGIHIEQAFLINRSPQELYQYWRNLENLPRIMSHLESVRVIDERRSHWVARPPGIMGKRIEWDAEITRDEPNSVIAWRSLQGSDIQTAGEIRFSKAMGDRGTEAHAFMDYVPPAGPLGQMFSWLFTKGTRKLIREDMRNFKRIMEMGEIPTITGQPRGTCTGRGKTEGQ